MALEWVDLESKHPAEVLQYKFPLTGISAFADDGETVSTVTFHVYDTANTSVDLATTMVAATSSGSDYVTVEIRSDVSGKSYYVVGIVTGATGRKYGVFGKFTSKNLGVSAT